MLLSIKSIQKSVVQLILESVLAYVDDDTEGGQPGRNESATERHRV